MDKFLKYIEDKEFVRWVLKPSKELDEYWKQYLADNPAEKEQIELSRLLIFQFKSKQSTESDSEKFTIYSEIINGINTHKKKSARRNIGVTMLKYAAVATLFFFIGITVFNLQQPDRYAELSLNEAEVTNENNAQLILGDGNNISIVEKTSVIKHITNGKVIINEADTVSSIPKKEDADLNQLIVPYGKNSSIQLPDGTIAYLNAGSRLVYPSRFDGKTREVYLVGEAFFEVAHNADKPFIAKTSALEIEVLGTRFNLSAYPSDKFVETVLVEGRVKVIEEKGLFVKKEYELEPNQLASFNRIDSEHKISNVDVLNYVTWHDGYLNFESSELNRIIKKLERYYNVQIKLAHPLTGQKAISGKLKLKEDVESALLVLAISADMELLKINETNYELK